MLTRFESDVGGDVIKRLEEAGLKDAGVEVGDGGWIKVASLDHAKLVIDALNHLYVSEHSTTSGDADDETGVAAPS